MKLNLKTTVLILTVALFSLSASAQRTKKADGSGTRGGKKAKTAALVGIWEYNNAPGLLKVFSGDNTFANLQITPNGTVKTHSGKFVVDNKQQYTEVIDNAIADSQYALAGQTYHINYVFSDDNKTVTLKGAVKGKNGEPGVEYTEVLHKL